MHWRVRACLAVRIEGKNKLNMIDLKEQHWGLMGRQWWPCTMMVDSFLSRYFLHVEVGAPTTTTDSENLTPLSLYPFNYRVQRFIRKSQFFHVYNTRRIGKINHLSLCVLPSVCTAPPNLRTPTITAALTRVEVNKLKWTVLRHEWKM